jgi:hypothetical protein
MNKSPQRAFLLSASCTGTGLFLYANTLVQFISGQLSSLTTD